MPKILGGEARGRKIVRMATKWDTRDYPMNRQLHESPLPKRQFTELQHNNKSKCWDLKCEPLSSTLDMLECSANE